MLNNLDAFLDLAARKQGGRLAVAACHDKDVLLACIEAEKRGLCHPILIGDGTKTADLLTALERIGDHCSNIAGCIVDMAHNNMNMHEALRSARIENEHFGEQYKAYAAKYSLKK